MGEFKINIDKKIDERKCPGPCYCVVATTEYPEPERKRLCYRCWKEYCRQEKIEIGYEDS